MKILDIAQSRKSIIAVVFDEVEQRSYVHLQCADGYIVFESCQAEAKQIEINNFLHSEDRKPRVRKRRVDQMNLKSRRHSL